jgi:hypothetical protein
MAQGQKTGGRVKGTPNKRTQEIQALARSILEQPAYLAMLTQRACAGTLPPAVETMLFYYAYGKPKDSIEHRGTLTYRVAQLQAMSDAQLLALLAARNGQSA